MMNSAYSADFYHEVKATISKNRSLLRIMVVALSVSMGLQLNAYAQEQQSSLRKDAFAAEQAGELQHAEEFWKRISELEQNNPEAPANVGLIEARRNNFAEAVLWYKRALAISPMNTTLRMNLGLAYFKGGSYRDAIEIFQALMPNTPQGSAEHERLAILLGMSYYGVDDFRLAAESLKAPAEHEPKNLNLQLTLAHSCLLAEHFDCVLESFHRILAVDENSVEAYMLMGEAMDEMHDSEGALRAYRKAVEVGPHQPNVHFGLGYLLWMKSEYKDAAAEFEKEIALSHGHLLAREYLADARMMLNEKDAARELLESAVKEDPKSAMAWVDLGTIHAEEGRTAEAAADFEKAIQIAPENVNAHWRVARVYKALDRTADAKREMETAQKLNKNADEKLLKVMQRVGEGQSQQR